MRAHARGLDEVWQVLPFVDCNVIYGRIDYVGYEIPLRVSEAMMMQGFTS